jgi:hypothetical protein
MKFRVFKHLNCVAVAVLVLSAHSASAQELIPRLGEPPFVQPGQSVATASELPQQRQAASSLAVNPASREEARNFINLIYQASEGVAMGWTGNIVTGEPGTTTQPFRDAVALRINFFRAMAGVPADITLSDEYSRKDQQAALMMSANNFLSHAPPTNWVFYTAEGAEAAGKSNLALGSAGADAITGYIRDQSDNNSKVGHRRWLLYPQTKIMGSGDVPGGPVLFAANATWVVDSNYGHARPDTREEFVSWPPPGFVPYPITFARWSFSYPGADFQSALVSMTNNSVNVDLRKEDVGDGYGENTVVWVPAFLDSNAMTPHPRPATDTVYHVTVQNVLIGGNQRTFNYDVTVFDPAVPGADYKPPLVSGPDIAGVNQANAYTFTGVAGAESYQWQVTQRVAFTSTEGAETGLSNVLANTSAGYNVIVSSPKASGSFAFHLAHPEPEDQSLTLNRLFRLRSGSQLSFSTRLGWATSSQTARAQITVDEGKNWTDVWSKTGTDGSGDSVFTRQTISLNSFVGKEVMVRFVYDFLDGSFFNDTTSGVGFYLDDIALSNADQLIQPAVADILSGTTFNFTPSATGDYALRVRGKVYGSYFLDWGPSKLVTAQPGVVPPAVRITRVQRPNGTQVQIDFELTSGSASTFHLQTAAQLPATWTTDAAAVIQAVTAPTRFRATTSTAGATRQFYRITTP